MLRIYFTFLFICLITINETATAQSSSRSTNSVSLLTSQPKTQILILATPHLVPIREDFSPTLLDSLISVLEAYHPDVIGIEELSGSQIAHLDRRGGAYRSIVQFFGHSHLKYGKRAQRHLGLTWAEAKIKADSLMEDIQQLQNVTDTKRLELINFLVASYRLYTAALQWSYVSDHTRSMQSVIPEGTAELLSLIPQTASESASIGLRLAHNLGLQQLFPIDDHMEKDYLKRIGSQLDQALNDSLDQVLANASFSKKWRCLMKQGIENGDLYPVYQYMNSAAYLEQNRRIEWRETFWETEVSVLRKRLALWEVRNLNIAAHIRKASSTAVGGRTLIIIGASHKSFLDAYLWEMMGAEVVSLSDIAKS